MSQPDPFGLAISNSQTLYIQRGRDPRDGSVRDRDARAHVLSRPIVQRPDDQFSVHTPDLASTAESQNLLGIGDGLKMDPNQCHWMKERLAGFSGKVAVTGGYREVKQARARAPLGGIEPICAHAVSELKDLAPEADIFVRIIAKNNPLVCKADHFDMMLLELETFPGVKMIAIKPHTGKEHPSLLTSEPISLLEMGKEGKKLQVLPKNQNDKSLLAIQPLLLSISLSFVNSTVSLDVDQQLDSRIPQWGSRFMEIECKQSNPLAGVTKKLLPIKPKKIYKAKEIKRATNYFSSNNILNSGGNGEVYWGKLDGTEAAVKRPYQGEDIERYTDHIVHELNIHGQVNHQSIVALLGHGLYQHRPHVVYEFMPRGSLFEQLHDHYHAGGSTILTWQRRLTIAHQIAECLTYLHNYSVPRIFHVDVKSANILLDDNLNAKKKAKNLEKGDDGAVLVKKHELMDAIDPSLKVGASEVAWKQMMALGSLAVDCLSKQIKYRPPVKQVADKIECIRKWDFCTLSVTYVRS
ncbi:hypothetical protein MRB53_035399 [Persea americana]|uniref:Uncharacterized protein n=1 Tax=Persea americana TaxID=3435 RepID=A0ACC2K4S4_PERAE|nr:hypothetical protein MRB53_035399 [Persea americana]